MLYPLPNLISAWFLVAIFAFGLTFIFIAFIVLSFFHQSFWEFCEFVSESSLDPPLESNSFIDLESESDSDSFSPLDSSPRFSFNPVFPFGAASDSSSDSD